MIKKEETTIGFIGIGVMGKSMVRNLINAGYSVIVYTRTKSKAEDLLSEGVKWANSPKEIAQNANVIITIIGYPKDVEEVYLGQDGIVLHANEGSYLIDMTTSTPSLAKRIYKEAEKRHLFALDAPVSGGDIGAREGKLSIMVGGDSSAFTVIEPIFQVLGTNIIHQGKAGAGQHTKMCNQIAIASNMIGVCEAIVYAENAGLNPEKVLQSISSGAAASFSLSNLAPRMINGDFAPGFYIKHFIKDMRIALEEAELMEMETPGLALAESLYSRLSALGESESGTQALYKYWTKN